MFRLEKILSLRKREEEILKDQLNKVRLRIRQVEEEIEKTQMTRKEVEDQLRTSQSGAQVSFLLYLLRMYNDYIKLLNDRLSNLRSEEETILRNFLEKRTERRSFEKLKERYLEHEKLQLDRKERLIIDEVALQKYFRNTRGE